LIKLHWQNIWQQIESVGGVTWASGTAQSSGFSASGGSSFTKLEALPSRSWKLRHQKRSFHHREGVASSFAKLELLTSPKPELPAAPDARVTPDWSANFYCCMFHLKR